MKRCSPRQGIDFREGVHPGLVGAIGTEPGGEVRDRMKGQTVWAQRVFAPPVPDLAERGCLSGLAAFSFDSFLWARKEKDAHPAGIPCSFIRLLSHYILVLAG